MIDCVIFRLICETCDQLNNKFVDNLLTRLKIETALYQPDHDLSSDTPNNELSRYQQIYLRLLEQQRHTLYNMNKHSEYDEELIRKHLSLIDLEELKFRSKSLLKNLISS